MHLERTPLTFAYREIGPWTIPTIEFNNAPHAPLSVAVNGTIINSITTGATGREKQQSWKAQVASAVKAKREEKPWNSGDEFAISIGLSFHSSNHRGHTKMDAENFIKPIIDAIAAGLFCDQQTEPKSISRWDYDDSNFNTLLIHRLADADNHQGEGIAVCVSSSKL